MAKKVHRTVLTATVVVETDSTEAEHQRTVAWAANTMKGAHRHVRDGAVAIQVIDSDTKATWGFAGHGNSFSEDSNEIVAELFEPEPHETPAP